MIRIKTYNMFEQLKTNNISYNNFKSLIIKKDLLGIKEMHSNGYDINTIGPNGDNGLIVACLKSTYEIIDFLIQNNSNVNIQNVFWNTPLFASVKKNKLDVVQLLIKYNVNLNIKSIDIGNNALMFAAIRKYENILILLLDNGAKIIKNNNSMGRNLLYYMKRAKYEHIIIKYSNIFIKVYPAFVKQLLSKTFNI